MAAPFENLPSPWLVLAIFAAMAVLVLSIQALVARLAIGERADAFKALSPGLLPPLGIVFGLVVGFVAVQAWANFGKAKAAVDQEASELREAMLISVSSGSDAEARIRSLIRRHIDQALTEEWARMAEPRATVITTSAPLAEALQFVFAMVPTNTGQADAQRALGNAVEAALAARRERIIVSQESVGVLKWIGMVLQGISALIATALIHCGESAHADLGHEFVCH
jgi:hypothetical protein